MERVVTHSTVMMYPMDRTEALAEAAAKEQEQAVTVELTEMTVPMLQAELTAVAAVPVLLVA